MSLDDDFFNSEEYKNMDEESKRMLKKLLELKDVNTPDEQFTGEPGLFIQKLDDEDFNNQLDNFINQYEMTQEIEILLNHELADKVIEETWISKDGSIRMKRYYEFTYDNINLLRPESRRIVYDLIMTEALNKEDYEIAAEIRDSIYLNEQLNFSNFFHIFVL